MDDPRIDEAINSIPLAELPEGFVPRTMDRIANQRKSIRFRFNFIDIALPAFFSIFLLVLLGVGQWVYNQINPRWLQYMQLEVAHYFKLVPSSSSLGYQAEGIILLALVFFLFSALMLIWVVSRPRQIRVTK